MFLALGLLLPFVTGQIPQIGSKLLPMHIPVYFMCFDLRLAVWRNHWFCAAAASLAAVWNACLFSVRNGNGL